MGRNLTENEYLLVIELAGDWSKDIASPIHQPTAEENIKAKAEAFDQAYKAIIKTVVEIVPD